MQHEVEDQLSEHILQGELNAGDHVKVDFVDGAFTFETGRQPGREEVLAGVPAIEAVTPEAPTGEIDS
jgi:ATP-dependent Clp protease ATP-binding subunit ClpC